MHIIEKEYAWNGIPGKRVSTGYVILHHAAAKSCSADDVHRWHLDNGWCGIGYNFFVRKDGSVYRGRAENAVGAHTIGYNSMSVGICFEGNFEVEQMPEDQIKAGQELVAYLKAKYPGVKLGRHKDFDSTACPGRYFPYDTIISGTSAASITEKEVCSVELPILQKGDESGCVRTLQILLNKYNNAALDEDGDFGPKTHTAVQNYQRSRRLGIDGIVGPQTWTKLLK